MIAHFGDPATTLALLVDVVRQDHEPLEVIVVDDASPVPLPADRLPAGCRLVRNETNRGYGAALNAGAALARQPLLLLLNNDLVLAPGLVGDLVRAAAPHQPCVAGPATIEGGTFLFTGRRFPRVWRHVVEDLTPLAHWESRRAYQRAIGRDVRCQPGRVVTDVDWLQGSVLLLPRQAFEQVGGFDERFFLYSEEVDLQNRLRDLGVRAVFTGTVSVEHAGGLATGSAPRTEWLVRSQITYARKYGFESRLRIGWFLTALLNLGWGVALRATGHDASPRTAFVRQRHLATQPAWPETPTPTTPRGRR